MYLSFLFIVHDLHTLLWYMHYMHKHGVHTLGIPCTMGDREDLLLLHTYVHLISVIHFNIVSLLAKGLLTLEKIATKHYQNISKVTVYFSAKTNIISICVTSHKGAYEAWNKHMHACTC